MEVNRETQVARAANMYADEQAVGPDSIHSIPYNNFIAGVRYADGNPLVRVEPAYGEGKEYILCAAIHYDDGVLRPHPPRNLTTGLCVGGWRHHNCFTILNAALPGRDKNIQDIQGFLTSKGNFLNRMQAANLAWENGQLKVKKTKVYSEDLWS